jgi:hypothetical protein
VQVEQDLDICRALVDLFSRPLVASALAFRGGTALYKLHLFPARDIAPLLAAGTDWDMERAFASVLREVVALLPGAPWRGAKTRGHDRSR